MVTIACHFNPRLLSEAAFCHASVVSLETLLEPAASTTDADYYVGVEVGETVIRAGLFSKTLRLVGKTKLSTKAERGSEAVVGRIARCVLYTADECDLPIARVWTVGVGIPGQVEAETGLVNRSSDLAWTGMMPGLDLQRTLNCPVAIANSHNLATYGIYSQELTTPPRSLAALFLGPQIVGGLMEGDRFIDLTEFFNAEDGFEDLEQNIFSTLPHPQFRYFRSRDFRKALKKGRDNLLVRQFLIEIAKRAGEIAAQLTTRFSPEVIVFGGGVMDEFGDEIMATACAAAKAKLGCELADRTLLVASTLGDLAGITGAAAWAMRKNRQALSATSSVALDPVH